MKWVFRRCSLLSERGCSLRNTGLKRISSQFERKRNEREERRKAANGRVENGTVGKIGSGTTRKHERIHFGITALYTTYTRLNGGREREREKESCDQDDEMISSSLFTLRSSYFPSLPFFDFDLTLFSFLVHLSPPFHLPYFVNPSILFRSRSSNLRNSLFIFTDGSQ